MQLGTFDQFEALKAETDLMSDEVDRITRLCEFTVSDPRLALSGDPFSEDYRRGVLDNYLLITGRKLYDPKTAELSPFVDPVAVAKTPSVYGYRNSKTLGEFMATYGAVLNALDVKAGDSVLEYGAGDGQIALMLARIGCDVSVIDLEPNYLQAIKLQADAFGIEISATRGEFGENFPDGRTYDRILFFEAFHHCVEHQSVLPKLRGLLKPGGKIVFAGEPIIDPEGHWKDAVPFPWGPRMDGLSIRAMKWYGWFELGFQKPYFEQLLQRNGFDFSFVPCPMTGRGDCYIASQRAA